jgi:hypothetical protein
MLAILELALFMGAEIMTEQIAYIPPEFTRSVQCKQSKAVTRHASNGKRRPTLLFHRGAPHSSSNKDDGGRRWGSVLSIGELSSAGSSRSTSTGSSSSNLGASSVCSE